MLRNALLYNKNIVYVEMYYFKWFALILKVDKTKNQSII